MDIHDILVIDDSRLQRQHAMDLCRQLGIASVREAPDGERGLTLMRVQMPDLLLLDLEMPKQDGVQVMQEMARAGLSSP